MWPAPTARVPVLEPSFGSLEKGCWWPWGGASAGRALPPPPCGPPPLSSVHCTCPPEVGGFLSSQPWTCNALSPYHQLPVPLHVPHGASFLALTPSDTHQIPPRPEQHRLSVPLAPNSGSGCPGCNAHWWGELHEHLSKFVQCSWTRGVGTSLQAPFPGAAPASSVLAMAPWRR